MTMGVKNMQWRKGGLSRNGEKTVFSLNGIKVGQLHVKLRD